MKQEKSKADFQLRIALVVVLMLAAVIFIPLYWAVEPARQAAATVTPPPQPTAPTFLSSEQGQTIFEQKCIACHSIGKGKLVGPDLKGVTGLRNREWLIRFIIAPEKLIAEDDPVAQQLVEEYGGIKMPNMGLSESEAEEVLAYIEAQADGEQAPLPTEQDKEPTAPAPTEKPALTKEITPALRGDASTGRAIFTGTTALENSGPACISCHNVSGIGSPGGGSVGRDLTDVYARFGEAGLASVMRNTPFPIMGELYAGKLLTDGEIANLVAFLQEAGKEEQAQPQNRNVLIIVSIAAFLLILGIFQYFWRGRLVGVRQRLVRGGSR